MALISQSVRNWFAGVSRQPQNQRSSAHMNEMLNGMVYNGRMVGRRPPTFHVSEFASAVPVGATVIPIVRSASEKYTAVVSTGLLKVFNDFTGAETAVYTPEGLGYLSSTLEGIRSVTTGDRTVIVNRGVTVRKGTATAPAATDETLVVIRQGNFGTNYRIIVNGVGHLYTTPASTSASAEAAISTENIATQLLAAMNAYGYAGVFNLTLTGSTIRIVPVTKGNPYTVTTEDGLGNDGMSVLRGRVQRFSDLPTQAPDGTQLEIRGDESTAFDNFWVEFDAETSVWEEIVAPDALLGYDASTMPHLLEYKGRFLDSTAHQGASSNTVFTNSGLSLSPNALVGHLCKNLTDGSQGTVTSNTATSIYTTALTGGGTNNFRDGDLVEVVGYGTYFIFKSAPWATRVSGDVTTNPYASLTDGKVRDVAIVQGRLALVSDYTFVLSRPADIFNLFRKTVTIVEPDGPIDIEETLPSSSKFHAILEWDGKLIAWSDLAQYEVGGEPALTPETVTIRRISQYPNLASCRPIVSGTRMFFVGVTNGLTKVLELTRYGQDERVSAQSITEDIPDYIVGAPIRLEGDETNGVLAILTRDGTANHLYVFTYVLENGQRVSQAWGRWEIGTPIPPYTPSL